MTDLMEFERPIWGQKGLVAGFDEAGAGPLAGPVVAACVIIDPKKAHLLHEVDDSKRLSAKKRDRLSRLIPECSIDFGLHFVYPGEIDEINVFQASLRAMERAWGMLALPPRVDLVLIDGPNRTLDLGYHRHLPQTNLVKGDSRSLSIAAASIMAKAARDAYMVNRAEMYPQYGFAQHKGYGTPAHIEALKTYGPCPLHRITFEPVKSLLAEKVVTL